MIYKINSKWIRNQSKRKNFKPLKNVIVKLNDLGFSNGILDTKKQKKKKEEEEEIDKLDTIKITSFWTSNDGQEDSTCLRATKPEKHSY